MFDAIALPASRILNVLQHQVGWFACVLGAAWGHPLLGCMVALAAHTTHVFATVQPMKELKLMFTVALLGTVLDSIHRSLGVLSFASSMGPSWLAPLWISMLWLGFATTLAHSLAWLRDRYALAALLGFIGGPLSFFAGYRLNAVAFPQGLPYSLFVIACVWALVMPCLIALAKAMVANDPPVPYRFFSPRLGIFSLDTQSVAMAQASLATKEKTHSWIAYTSDSQDVSQ
ncbi:MAG: DUF2878 domain-containing protein [Myxococcales bacterium]|nr:MAG: DUF2878 domain-containing protein [Myxococcales bacterium]